MRIVILAHNLYGVGGTVRTVYNLAAGLTEQNEVELVSVYRRTNDAAFELPMGVKLTYLVDGRPGSSDRKQRAYSLPSARMLPTEELYRQYSLLTDERIIDYLSNLRADVVMGTRSCLNLMIAEYAPATTIRIAQEHSVHAQLDEPTRRRMSELYGRLDAVTTVSNAEAVDVRATLARTPVSVRAIPNSVPAPRLPPSTGSNKLIIAAGRIDAAKRFELLIQAFAQLASAYPSWNLRIYGDGKQLRPLKDLIRRLGMVGRIRMMGRVSAMGDEWTKASIGASTSDWESFGMTLVESMRAGAPVVSTDCPVGPREIITSGVDGVLVPTGDVDALKDKLRELIENPESLEALRRAALKRASDYDPSNIAELYQEIIAECRTRTAEPSRRNSRLRSMFRRPPKSRLIEFRASTVPGGDVDLRAVWSKRAPRRVVIHGKSTHDEMVSIRPVRDDSGTSITARVSRAAFNNDANWRFDVLVGGRVQVPARVVLDNSAIVDTPLPHGELRHAIAHEVGGRLRVQAWKRRRHIEVIDAQLTEDGLALRLRATFDLNQPAEVVAVRRTDGEELIVSSIGTPATTEFSLTLPLSPLTEMRRLHHEDWDLFVRSGGKRIRIGRLLDDIPARKAIDSFPTWTYWDDDVRTGTLQEAVSARPFFSTRNNLAVSVTSE